MKTVLYVYMEMGPKLAVQIPAKNATQKQTSLMEMIQRSLCHGLAQTRMEIISFHTLKGCQGFHSTQWEAFTRAPKI